MENEFSKSLNNLRFSSISSASNLLGNDPEDPISAYFKKRCETSGSSYFKSHRESDGDSSLGLIDVDNVSLFCDGEDKENDNSLRNSFPIIERSKSDRQSVDKIRISNASLENSLEPEIQMKKQRVLAQKALKRFDRIDETLYEDSHLQPDNSAEPSMLTDHSKNLNEIEKQWFQPNFSPNTPRYFNDELSSFGGENSTLRKSEVCQNLLARESQILKQKNRISQSERKLSSVMKSFNQLDLGDDMEFKPQSKEEQICKLEEDERQFRLENSGLLHNSRISHFSEDLPQWSSTENLSKTPTANKNLSIGQFFNMRSNRISSLVGFEGGKNDNVLISPPTKDYSPSSFLHEQSLPVSNVSKIEKSKPRRCLSTYDLKQGSEISRFSSDSTTSNSTVMIQNILAEMESGLSGTQIYDKLIRAYGMKKGPQEGRKSILTEKKELQGNNETPKSSKTPKKWESVKKKENVRDEPKNFRKILELERLTPSPDSECKENQPINDNEDSSSNQSISILRNEKIKQLKGKRGFDASTPKVQHVRVQDDKFKSACKNVLMERDDWEVPRVSSIQPIIDVNRTDLEDIEKTLTSNVTVLSSECTKKNNKAFTNGTRTIEDTIVAGDLTVLSQRIDEMKEDGVCIVRSKNAEEPVLLTVVQKLADLPKGSVDCTSLTPLIRDQFPELLSNFPTPSSDHTLVNKTYYTPPCDKGKSSLTSEPGCWVKLPAKLGVNDKLISFVDVKKDIYVPVLNTSNNWLLISVDSVTISHPSGGRLTGVKEKDAWNICDFVFISMKDSIVPPKTQQMLQIAFLSKVVTKIDWKITFLMKQLLGKDIQTRSVQIRTQNLNPLNSMNLIPNDSINFGVIADQCSDQRTFQLTFDGLCELPLIFYIEEENFQSTHFALKPLTSMIGDSKGEWIDDKFYITLREGEKQLIEFLVLFQPTSVINSDNKIQDFKASLIVQTDDGTNSQNNHILQKIPIKGSVSLAKFFWNASCSPLVFRVPEKGQSLTRSFPLKNVGNLPIAFSIKIEDEDDKNGDEDEGIFIAPKSFYLSRNEESAINVTFSGNINENCVKRVMSLQIKPNGRAKYDVELIGIVNASETLTRTESRPLSRTSNISASTKSLSNTESVPLKLLTTTNCLSWASVPLEKELRQTFQLKNASSLTATTRITFKNNLGSFRLVNENGEKVQKIRKVLKPDCPFNLTVAFRPDSVGPHHNALFIETNQLSGKKMILLNGIGGMPNLFIGNVKSDLNGCKMIILQNNQCYQTYSNTLEFRNAGRIPGFILIKSSVEALSLSHELIVSPPSCIIPPDSKVSVTLSQKLKNDDLRLLLSGKDISKLATLSVIMGDEPSRRRLRKLVESGKVLSTERSKILTSTFEGEREMNVKSFEDSASFENQFLKSLRVVEVAVVIEKSSGICEPTILVDEDETIDEFVTICSAMDSTITSSIASSNKNNTAKQVGKPIEKSPTSVLSTEMNSSHNKIAKWLETLEYPARKSK